MEEIGESGQDLINLRQSHVRMEKTVREVEIMCGVGHDI